MIAAELSVTTKSIRPFSSVEVESLPQVLNFYEIREGRAASSYLE